MSAASAAGALEAAITEIGRRARAASRPLGQADGAAKDAALEGVAAALEGARASLLAANARDLEAGRAAGLAPAMLDRLALDDKRIGAMVRGVREVAALHDPVGEIIREWTRPNGLRIRKRRTPIGVIGIIYESRPNVTCDAAVLCLKTGNATVLRGGSEAFHSNAAIAAAMAEGVRAAGLPGDAVQLIPTTDRAAIPLLCGLDKFVDVLIPRGGHGLIAAVVEHARMPVIKHYHGVCHVFVDRDADFDMAERIIVNAKCQRPGVCNAMETLLVDRPVAAAFLPRIARALEARGVELRGDAASRALVPSMHEATEADWTAEYLDLILSIRVVDGLDEAVEHLHRYGSQHSDTIVTRNAAAADRFLSAVDSAAVFWNASTRFHDGGEFGFGAEIGISTDKLHARGPMGLEELTTYKYQVIGDGQVRE